MRIIPFEAKYRDDMIFMVLSAKDALGRVPRLNPDLLDIEAAYLRKGGGFWLALDDADRVIGCIGYSAEPDPSEVTLHRLYVKPALKRQGVGSALLETAEDAIRKAGKTAVRVHLGGAEYRESRLFYPKHGYTYTDPDHMRKAL